MPTTTVENLRLLAEKMGIDRVKESLELRLVDDDLGEARPICWELFMLTLKITSPIKQKFKSGTSYSASLQKRPGNAQPVRETNFHRLTEIVRLGGFCFP